jgi:hypothetical protein
MQVSQLYFEWFLAAELLRILEQSKAPQSAGLLVDADELRF